MPVINTGSLAWQRTNIVALGDNVLVGRTWDIDWIKRRSGRHQGFAVCPLLSVLGADVSWTRVKCLRDFVKTGGVTQLSVSSRFKDPE